MRLLGAAYSAVKAADPGATVVTAGLPNFSWKDLETLYRAGLRAKGHFDAVAVHPFTGQAGGQRADPALRPRRHGSPTATGAPASG